MGAFDDLIAGLGPADRKPLEHLRELVLRVMPEAEEGKSYGMAAFRYDGRPLLGVSVSKSHMSLHPFSPDVVEAVAPRLTDFSLSKGTIRFTPDQPVPDDVIEEMLRLRVDELTGG